MTNKQKAQTKPVVSKIEETFGVYVVPYQMAKDFWLEDLTEVHENCPANQRLSKDVAKRLGLSIDEITVRPLHDIDECLYIQLRIRGSKQDIEKVNKVLKARDESVEQTGSEVNE